MKRLPLYIFLSLISIFGATANVVALALPNTQADVGAAVFIDEIAPTHYYSIFGINDMNPHGDPCAFVYGGDLISDNDLSHYGSCFVNDAGVFKIVEQSDFFNGNYI